MNDDIIKSSGSVFADLGFHRMRPLFFRCVPTLWLICANSSNKKINAGQGGINFRVSQSRVSDLMRGKWERFSLEMLITLATKAGMHVSLKTAA